MKRFWLLQAKSEMTFLFHFIKFVLKEMNRGWREIKTMLPPVCVKSFSLSVLSFWEEKQVRSSAAPKSFLHSSLDDIHSELFYGTCSSAERNGRHFPRARFLGLFITVHWLPPKPYAEKKENRKMFAAKEQKQSDEFLPLVPSETLAANLLNPRLSWPIGRISFYEEVYKAIEIKKALNCGGCITVHIVLRCITRWFRN